jgi:hypothetical protein
LPRQQKNREFSVHAPHYIPKNTPILKDTTGTEALDVFKMAKRLGRAMSFAIVVVGIFIVILSAYSMLIDINIFLNPLFMGILCLLGALNILSGLLLLAKK